MLRKAGNFTRSAKEKYLINNSNVVLSEESSRLSSTSLDELETSDAMPSRMLSMAFFLQPAATEFGKEGDNNGETGQQPPIASKWM
jgi:hypothetical protein